MSSMDIYVEIMTKFTLLVAENLGLEDIPFTGFTEISLSVITQILFLLQEARKSYFARKGRKLIYFDLVTAFNMNYLEIPLGMNSNNHGKIHKGTVNGRTFYFLVDKPISTSKTSFHDPPLVCRKGRLHGHWLAVDGKLVDAPENVCCETQDSSVLEIQSVRSKHRKEKNWGGPHLQMLHRKYLTKVVLSCVGDDDSKRYDAFSSLSIDTGLQLVLPFVLNFVSEGIRAQIGSLHNIHVLQNLLMMVDSILNNQSLCLERYLEGILPDLLSCVVCSRIGSSLDQLGVRVTAAKLTARVARTFDSPSNHLHGRIASVYSHVDWTRLSLFSIFGIICGLGELGVHVVRTFLVPSMPTISAHVSHFKDCPDDEKMVEFITGKMRLYVSPILSDLCKEGADCFNDKFGMFGEVLRDDFVKGGQPSPDIYMKSEARSMPPTGRIRAVVLTNEDLD